MSIPVVFVRSGSPFYGTPISIKCAKKYNERVVFIGDIIQPTEHRNLTEFYPMEDYSDAVNELNTTWPYHGLPNSWFNWACLIPWLVLCEWCEKHNEDFVCILDGDVLAFASMDIPHWRQFDFSACNATGNCAQAPSFTSLHALKCFRLFLIGIFSGKLTTESPIEVIKDQCKCCMSAWQHAAGHFSMTQGNLCLPVDGAVFDHSLSAVQGFEHNGKEKVLTWLKGQPYGRRDGKLIRLNNLHCWADAKARMGDYVKASEESLLT